MEVEVAKVFMSKIIDIDSKTTNFNKSGIKSDDFTLTIPNIRLKGSTTNIEIKSEETKFLIVYIDDIKYRIPLYSGDMSPEMHRDGLIELYELENLESETYKLLIGPDYSEGINTLWDQTTVVSTVNENNTIYMKLKNFDYQVWDFNHLGLDFSTTMMDLEQNVTKSLDGTIHLGIWTNKSIDIYLKFVNTTVLSSDNKPTEYITTIATENAKWTNVSIDLSEFTFNRGDNTAEPINVFSSINRMIIGTNDENYKDNVYIHYLTFEHKNSKPHIE
jgi:hypothetical protein